MIALTIPVIGFCFIRTYKAMSFLTIPSVIVSVMGIITIFVYSFKRISNMSQETNTPAESINVFDFAVVIGRIGIIMHVFAGNPSIVNIYSESKYQNHYPHLVKLAVCFCLGLYTFYASISYIAYRETTQPIFIMSMVPLDPFILFLFICFSANSMTSYPVQILCAF